MWNGFPNGGFFVNGQPFNIVNPGNTGITITSNGTGGLTITTNTTNNTGGTTTTTNHFQGPTYTTLSSPSFNVHFGVPAAMATIVPPPAPAHAHTPIVHMMKATGPNGESVTYPFPTTVQEFSPYVASADPPIPPNWTQLCNNTIPTLPFKTVHKFPLAPESVEYQTLAWMIEPSCNVQITGMDQIVNEELWNKFLIHRKETMLTKCQDLQILSGFKLPDRQLASILSINVNSDPKRGTVLGGMEYSDNVCLLFHCTRGNLEAVLEEGLDERVGNGGNLGRGIYFSDDPLKAMNYDTTGGTLLIYLVYLGDCLSSTEIQNVTTSTREPRKFVEQSRTERDRSFDSIAGAPFQHQNEYVIYNRYQCVPIYLVKYVRLQTPIPATMTNDLFYRLRRLLPEFVWKKVGKARMATPGQTTNPCPLHAHTIFQLMKSYNVKIQALHNIPPPRVPDEHQKHDISSLKTATDEQEKLVFGLSELFELGFEDDNLNGVLLKKHNFNLELVIMELIQLTTAPSQTNLTQPAQSTSTSGASSSTSNRIQRRSRSSTAEKRKRLQQLNIPPDIQECLLDSSCMDDVLLQAEIEMSVGAKTSTIVTNGHGDGAVDSTSNSNTPNDSSITCNICCEEYESDTYMRKLGSCEHSLCRNCFKEMETSGTTMSGSTHTFLKCPFCSKITGVQIGDCPAGTMISSTIKINNTSWIQINYQVPSHGLHRVAYLPFTTEGKRVLELLKIAWERRIIFTIGTSHTTGQANAVVWNIHHKTTTDGGEMNHGYPDPGYLDRVKDELKQYGIEPKTKTKLTNTKPTTQIP